MCRYKSDLQQPQNAHYHNGRTNRALPHVWPFLSLILEVKMSTLAKMFFFPRKGMPKVVPLQQESNETDRGKVVCFGVEKRATEVKPPILAEYADYYNGPTTPLKDYSS